jgi:hypothetical protein
VTATGPRLSAGLRAPDQRPNTGVIGRYFLYCLRAGYDDALKRGARLRLSLGDLELGCVGDRALPLSPPRLFDRQFKSRNRGCEHVVDLFAAPGEL